MPRVWRITRSDYRKTVLSGRGSSSRDGARWNLPGVAAVCLSSSGALALAEILVHVRGSHIAKAGLSWFAFDLPDDEVATVETETLPSGWDSIPPTTTSQAIGSAFLQTGKFLALKVPSVIVPFEHNYLLNPDHRAASKLRPVEERPVR